MSNCLSVQPLDTPFGRKTHIDQNTCNLDYSCLEGDCPAFIAITVDESAGDRGEPGMLRRVLGRGRAAGRAMAEKLGEQTVERAGAPVDLPEPQLQVPTDDFAMRITGIGGTGVVTVAQVLGTAAMLGGFEVRGLDQIGLSQKAGPVVSDLRLSRSAPTATNRLGEGQADLLLALDQLVAASPRGLLTADINSTAVVGSTSGTPTGEMITHLDVRLPAVGVLSDRIASATRSDVQHWADARLICQEIFGSSTAANIFVVGMALQAGCLPVSAGDIERAIDLNGVAVAANLEAFRWGRAQIARPEAVEAARVAGHPPAPAPAPELSDALRGRIDELHAPTAVADELMLFAAELVAWQDEAVAGSWLDVLKRVAEAERRVASGSSALVRAVAANLYKLTAYKDEYEVARLMTDSDALATAREVAGARGKVAWKLHPPMLRALGLDNKISIGSWAEPVVHLLARGKKLRGTALDPFRWPDVRRVERQLPGEYVEAIDRVLDRLSAGNVTAAVEIAELPDLVRGYEHIKLANVARYRATLSDALAAFV